MAKSIESAQPVAASAPEAAPQPPQQYYQQPVYAPRPPKVAKHPGLELTLAIFSVLVSTWLLIDALSGAISLFGGRGSFGFDPLLSLLFSGLSGYAGVTIAAIGSVVFAGAAFWLFRRLSAALESDAYKATLQVGAGIALVKTGVLAISTVGAGIAPLLTIREGSDVGPAYLYEFLPLFLATGVFTFVTWYLLKLANKEKVTTILSTALLIVTSLVFILAFVAIVVRSHASTSSRSSSSSSQQYQFDDVDDSSSGSSNSGSGSSSSLSECYSAYTKDRDYQAYTDCLKDI